MNFAFGSRHIATHLAEVELSKLEYCGSQKEAGLREGEPDERNRAGPNQTQLIRVELAAGSVVSRKVHQRRVIRAIAPHLSGKKGKLGVKTKIYTPAL